MEDENRTAYGDLGVEFWARKPIIGMVHLGPLPGSPRDTGKPGSFDTVLTRAADDARALAEGGADAIMVENFFDAPFAKTQVPAHTVAALTRATLVVREAAGLQIPVGVNCLRNDVCSALSIAHICGARFVRVNVFVGAAVTDQGIIEGAARDALLYRRELGANIALWADVFVKHAVQLGATGADGELENAARDAAERGLADALIVSGSATGAQTPTDTVRRVARAVPSVLVLVGSGFDAHSAAALLAAGASGAIVGTSLKANGSVSGLVEANRVRLLRTAMNHSP